MTKRAFDKIAGGLNEAMARDRNDPMWRGFVDGLKAERDAALAEVECLKVVLGVPANKIASTLYAAWCSACRERDAALAQSDEWHEKFQDEMERNAKQALELDAALARAEVLTRERDEAMLEANEVGQKAANTQLWLDNASLDLRAALARVRALEEGMWTAIAALERIACDIAEDAGGVDFADEVRAGATELRALLAPPKEDGK